MKRTASSHHASLGVPCALALVALCTSITHCGNDDVPSVGSSGKGGTTGSSGMAGSSGASGRAGTGGSGAAQGSGGSAGATSGGSAGTSGVDASSDGADSGGDAFDDASGNPDAGDAAEDVFVDPTVRGVLKTVEGLPLEGLTVVIGQNTTVSNARGEFTVSNVPPTYDLLVLPNASKHAPASYVYVGLSSRKPVARIKVTETPLRTTVRGNLSAPGTPPGYPQGPLDRTGIGFKPVTQDTSPDLLSRLILQGEESAYGPLDVAWLRETTVSGQLFALQWTVGTTPFPTGYRRWVIQPFSLTAGMPATADLVLAAVSQREVTGSARFPQNIQSLRARLDVESITVFDNSVTFSTGAASVNYAYPIPTLGSAARVLSFRATHPGGIAFSELKAKVVDTTAMVDFELPAAPSPALPVDRATGVDHNTEFAWTAVPNAVYRLGIVSSSGATALVIHTATTSGKMPDLASKGVPLAAGNHLWAVEAAGPADSVDAFVTGTPFLEEHGRELSSFSQYRNFTARTP